MELGRGVAAEGIKITPLITDVRLSDRCCEIDRYTRMRERKRGTLFVVVWRLNNFRGVADLACSVKINATNLARVPRRSDAALCVTACHVFSNVTF